MGHPKIKLIYAAVSGLLPFLQILNINHNVTYSITENLKTVAIFAFSMWEDNRSVLSPPQKKKVAVLQDQK